MLVIVIFALEIAAGLTGYLIGSCELLVEVYHGLVFIGGNLSVGYNVLLPVVFCDSAIVDIDQRAIKTHRFSAESSFAMCTMKDGRRLYTVKCETIA